MRHSTVIAFSFMLSLIVGASLAIPLFARAFEYPIATPGLWEVTYRTQTPGQSDPAIAKWQCITEEQVDDPWSAFGLPPAPDIACKKKSYAKNGRSISWKDTCTGPNVKITRQGSIRFDTMLHYTGKIRVDGEVIGYPIANKYEVVGVHRAACTSPED